MTKRLIIKITIIFLMAVTLNGCAPRYRFLVRDKAAAAGWTKEQQAVSEHLSYRLLCTKENSDGTFEINHACLPNETVAKIVKQRLDDLNSVLDYKNQEWAPYLKAFPNLREEAEREEKIFKAVYNRLKLVDFHNQFLNYLGERSSLRPMDLDLGYDDKKVFIEDVFAAYPFTSSHIEEARKNGKLDDIQTVLWFNKMKFDRKEPDPSDPNDPNKFIWQPKETGIELISYKILDGPKPQEKKNDYIEGTRFTISGSSFKRESKPALKIFLPEGRPAVIVSDYDKEGEIGFAIPDAVENFYVNPETSESLFNGAAIANLFQVTEKERRIPPKDLPPLNIEIAPIGQNKIEIWEEKSQGWTVTLRYKNDRRDNYNIRVKIKDDEKIHFDPTASKQIEYFKKEWFGNGNVVEFFKSKPPFDNPSLAAVSINGTKVLLITIQGQDITGNITTGPNIVIQDTPYQIEYTEGEKRWLIKDENGDGIYEKKRPIAK